MRRGAAGLLQRGLGDVHASAQQFDAALRYYEQAAASLEPAGAEWDAAEALLGAAAMHGALARPQQAAPVYQLAARRFAALDDPFAEAHCFFHLGRLTDAAHPDRAERHYARAAARYTEAGDRAAGGLRLANPHLPSHVVNPRREDAWIMAKVAEREIARLHPELDIATPESPPRRPLEASVVAGETARAATPAAALRAAAPGSASRAAAGLAVIALVFGALAFVAVPSLGHALLVVLTCWRAAMTCIARRPTWRRRRRCRRRWAMSC